MAKDKNGKPSYFSIGDELPKAAKENGSNMWVEAIYQTMIAVMRAMLKETSILIHDPLLAVFFSIALVVVASVLFKEENRIPYLASAVAVAFVLGLAFQILLQEDRPCVSVPGKIPCPEGFALPSMHALLAFTFAIAALGNDSFPLYMSYAMFVAFSRVYLGVHTINEVCAGLALAFLACVVTEMIWAHMKWKVPRGVHIKRDLGKLAP